jgi:hypothetical protein
MPEDIATATVDHLFTFASENDATSNQVEPYLRCRPIRRYCQTASECYRATFSRPIDDWMNRRTKQRRWNVKTSTTKKVGEHNVLLCRRMRRCTTQFRRQLGDAAFADLLSQRKELCLDIVVQQICNVFTFARLSIGTCSNNGNGPNEK